MSESRSLFRSKAWRLVSDRTLKQNETRKFRVALFGDLPKPRRSTAGPLDDSLDEDQQGGGGGAGEG